MNESSMPTISIRVISSRKIKRKMFKKTDQVWLLTSSVH